MPGSSLKEPAKEAGWALLDGELALDSVKRVDEISIVPGALKLVSLREVGTFFSIVHLELPAVDLNPSSATTALHDEGVEMNEAFDRGAPISGTACPSELAKVRRRFWSLSNSSHVLLNDFG